MPKLAFVVTADTEDAAAAIKKFSGDVGASVADVSKGGKASFTELNSALSLVKQGLEVTKQAWEFGKAGAENERIADSFADTAESVGVSADAMAEALDRAAKGTVDDEIFMQTATRNMALGVATSVQENVALMEMARASSIKFGGDTETAFAGISEAIGNLQTRQLKQYGIIIDQKKVNEEYAKSIGKTADALTDAEQREALRNEVLKQSAKLVGDAGNAALTTAEKFKKFETQAGNVIDSLKEFAVDAITPVLDRGAAMQTMMDDSASTADRLTAAYTLQHDFLAGPMRGVAEQMIPLLQQQIDKEWELFDAQVTRRMSLEQLAGAVQNDIQGAIQAAAAQNQLNIAQQAAQQSTAYDQVQQSIADGLDERAAASDRAAESARRDAEALAAQNAAALAAVNAHNSLATTLTTSKDPIDITKEALRGLQQMAGENELTAGRLQSALYSAGLASGLVTKESLAQAGAIERLNQLYAAGSILPEEYATGLKKIPEAAKDGVVSLEEMGIKTAGTLKKSKQDLLDEMGNSIQSTESEVSRAVDQSMRAVSTAASTAKSLVKGVGDAIEAIPEEKYIDIYIRVHGEIPDVGGNTGSATTGGGGQTNRNGAQKSGMNIADDLGLQVQAALNSGMGWAGV